MDMLLIVEKSLVEHVGTYCLLSSYYRLDIMLHFFIYLVSNFHSISVSYVYSFLFFR